MFLQGVGSGTLDLYKPIRFLLIPTYTLNSNDKSTETLLFYYNLICPPGLH